jgi:hypothetical protein
MTNVYGLPAATQFKKLQIAAHPFIGHATKTSLPGERNQ